MASGLLTRLIEGASDSLARAIYQRILDDRRITTGQALPSGAPTTWERIVASALDERILDRKEAGELLAEMRDEQMALGSSIPRNARWRRPAPLSRARPSSHRRSLRRRAA